jgi:hypothetical protein
MIQLVMPCTQCEGPTRSKTLAFCQPEVRLGYYESHALIRLICQSCGFTEIYLDGRPYADNIFLRALCFVQLEWAARKGIDDSNHVVYEKWNW